MSRWAVVVATVIVTVTAVTVAITVVVIIVIITMLGALPAALLQTPAAAVAIPYRLLIDHADPRWWRRFVTRRRRFGIDVDAEADLRVRLRRHKSGRADRDCGDG